MRKSIGGATAAIVAIAALVLAAAASAGGSGPHGKVLYRYVGQLKATSGATLTVTVQNGNRPALRSLLGQSQEQTFATDGRIRRTKHGGVRRAAAGNRGAMLTSW